MAKKSVLVSQNMVFLQKLASTNISNGFYLEEKLWTKENFSTNQKIRFH